MDKSESWGPQSGTFDDLIREQRAYIRKKIMLGSEDPSRSKEGEGARDGGTASKEDIADTLALLLGFACAMEYLLQRASKRPWRSIPELSAPLKSLVDQLLSGGDSEGAMRRLTAYFKTAIAMFGETHKGVERKLDEMSSHLAEELRPAKIMQQAKVAGLSKLLGLQEIAYWREFCRQVRRLDPEAVRDLA